MAARARGRILAWDGGSLWLFEIRPRDGEPYATEVHAHHAIQVTLSLGGRIELRTEVARVGGEAVAAAADLDHALAGDGAGALLFIEPESRLGRAVSRSLFAESGLVSIPRARLGDLLDRLALAGRNPAAGDAALVDLGRSIVARLAGGNDGDRPDLRVRRMIAHAAARLDRPVSLASAAEVARLSPDRARHLFVEQTGLPFRTYLLWLRLTRAVEVFAAGGSLTRAAHDAGFADSAHLSRTFRRMFGVTAASLQIE